jgi:TolA-binding protein
MKSLIIKCCILFLITSCSPSQQEKSFQENKDDSINKKKTSDSAVVANKLYLYDCAKLLREAKKMDSILLNELEVKTEIANKAIKAFTDFAYYCGSDSVCPIYLIKTAQVAVSVNNIPQAKLVLEKCISEHNLSIHLPAALFLLAQLYDETTYLNNENEAKKIYETIIKDFPTSDWAKSSRGALKFIGKSDEQILQELKTRR